MPATHQFDKRRFETFIDTSIAILLTILLLEIKVPETSWQYLQQFPLPLKATKDNGPSMEFM